MKTICLDFDGVIHLNSKFIAPHVINGAPVPGVVEAIQQLRKHFCVVVHSCRCNSLGGVEAINEWLKQYGIEVDDVVDYKPQAEIYVDDRAVAFNGHWPETIERIKDFKPYHYSFKKQRHMHRLRYR